MLLFEGRFVENHGTIEKTGMVLFRGVSLSKKKRFRFSGWE